MTALHVAAEKGDLEKVKCLVGLTDQEVDINIQDHYGVSKWVLLTQYLKL